MSAPLARKEMQSRVGRSVQYVTKECIKAKMMENKEVINKLREYFLRNDPEKVAHLCANFMIDLNRFLNINNLSQEERVRLIDRTILNMDQLRDFMESGNEDALELFLVG
jgi:hypothetical protein